MSTPEGNVPPRVHRLETALERILHYAGGASDKLAAQVRRHNAGQPTTVWDVEDVGRVLAHIVTEAQQALASSRRPEPGANGKGGGS